MKTHHLKNRARGPRAISCVALPFLAAACVTLPNADDAIATAVPAQWVADQAVAGAVEPDWWTRFDDKKLTALVAEALGENTQLGQADARTAQALAQAKIAGADRLPQLAATLDARRQKQNAGAFTGATGESITTESYSGALNVSWELDLWGRIRAQSKAARHDFLASEQNLRAVRQSIAAQTAKAYFAVSEARQQVELSARTVETFHETARQISNRADVGVASPTDKQLSIANHQSAVAGLEQRRDNLARATRRLEVILRDYPAGALRAGDFPTLPAMPSAGLPAEILERRPDVLAAKRQLEAAGLRTAAAQRALLPTISLTGSTGGQSSELGNILDGNFGVWSIGGQLVQPLFQSGRLIASIELAKGRQREAAEAYAGIVLQAFSEVETALTADVFFDRQERALSAASIAALESGRVAMNRYRVGLSPYITVLESQRRALDAEAAYLAVRRARLDNRVDLHLALGGAFETGAGMTAHGGST